MLKKSVYLICFSLALGSFLANSAFAADPNLVGWWKLDETSGAVAVDSSGNGYNGTLENGGTWAEGQLGGALELDPSQDQYVQLEIGSLVPTLNEATLSIWVNWSGGGAWQRFVDIGTSTANYLYMVPADNTGNMHIALAVSGSWEEFTCEEPLPSDGWHHVALTISESEGAMRLYLDGAPFGELTGMNNSFADLGATTNNWLGRSAYAADAYFNGMLDDFRIYNRILSQDELLLVMAGIDNEAESSRPNPEDEASDILRDIDLSWAPGSYADTHNLFFGTDFNDVNEATLAEPLSTTFVEGLDVNSYDPGRLEFGTTYFWRVDEVNAPSDPGTYTGQVWSFTVESYSIKIPVENITATAISSNDDNDPNDTINESGLNPDDMDIHSFDTLDMWSSSGSDVNDVWIQYDFDKSYKLHQMLVWNYNERMFLWRAGFKEVTIEYSEDGQTWTELEGVPEFAVAPGTNVYKYNTVVEFNGTVAKHVKLTAHSNWSDFIPIPNYGLSEVRFMYIPVRAREPNPVDGAIDVLIEKTLGWRAGREAAEHDVYLSTDQQAVIDGTADMETVNQASYSPSLGIGQTYFWRVDESNEAETPPVWQGDIWSFSTLESIIVEDFEDYNDTDGYTIWDMWKSGYDSTDNGGSFMGHEVPPYAEETIVYGGDQSAPVYYDNSGAFDFSEVVVSTSDLPIGSDWTAGNPQTLVLWIQGDVGNNSATDQLYVKVGNAKVVFDGDIGGVSSTRWMQFNVDLSTSGINLSNVPTLTVGVEEKPGTSGGSGKVYIDEIRLYGAAPEIIIPSEEIIIEAEAANTIDPPMEVLTELEGASDGQYIGTASNAGDSTSAPPTDGNATYNFTVAGGIYKLNFRVNITSGNDSLWVNIPGAATQTNNHSSGWVRFNDIAPGGNWHWDVVHSSEDNNTEVEWTMAAGTYTLQIAYREAGALLDAIIISKID